MPVRYLFRCEECGMDYEALFSPSGVPSDFQMPHKTIEDEDCWGIFWRVYTPPMVIMKTDKQSGGTDG